MSNTEEIVQGVISGDCGSIARAITIIENRQSNASQIIAGVFPHTGRAHIVGLTGPGGAGKSTLVEKIVREYRRRGRTVGVVAVDPTSPFTGGAFLGDRIRMQDLSTDEGVFIRSMASRNHSGGLARATKDAVGVLDAAGKDVILVETVGAGQSEVEIANVALTIVVVHAPGLGDEIQAIKAGLMEIADIFIVNKADRDGADKAVIDIQTILQLNSKKDGWKTPVLKTTALTGEGVSELVDKLEEHKRFSERETECNRNKMRSKTESELIDAIRERIAGTIIDDLRAKGKLDQILQRILKKEIDPCSAAEKLLEENLARN